MEKRVLSPELEKGGERQKTYFPKTRPRVHFADYYEVNPINPNVRDGYQQLAPGAPVAVNALWLHSALSSVPGVKGKKAASPSAVIKHLIDGFFEYSDLKVKGGSSVFIDHPVFKSLMLYAQHYLKCSSSDFIKAWNEKMSAAKQTSKKISQ